MRSGANSYNISYVYDPIGNRTVLMNSGALTTSTYNAANELVTSQSSAGVTTNAYDGSGDLLTALAPGSQRTTNTWDGEKRLTQVVLPSGVVNSSSYNGDGLRVQKQDSSGTTNHIWDGRNILLETNASNIIQVVYTLQPLLYGNLISQSRTGVDSFYLFDALGSIRQLGSTTGSVTDSYLYDSWGNSVAAGVNGTTPNPYRYVGKLGYYFDTDLTAYYVRTRIYFPAAAIFLSRDPAFAPATLTTALWDFSTMSMYIYAENSPFKLVDPSGMGVKIIPTPPKMVKYCENFCAKQGMVTAGPITTRVTGGNWLVGYGGGSVTRCNCRPCPKNVGNCSAQQLAYLQLAKDLACNGERNQVQQWNAHA